MRNIESRKFYPADLQKKIEQFNDEALKLSTEQQALESELATLRAQALSGDVDSLAGLGKKRDGLKAKLLQCLINSVRLAETRASFQQPIEEAYASERAKREEALTKRAEEVEEVFAKHKLGLLYLNGVKNETCQQLKSAVQEVVTPPKIEDENDRALIVELRRRIAEMM